VLLLAARATSKGELNSSVAVVGISLVAGSILYTLRMCLVM
jgi:hypothetical protein